MSTEKLPDDRIDAEKEWNEEVLKRKELAEEMLKEVQIIPNPPEQKSFILRLLKKKIPLLSDFLQSLGSTGSGTTSLIKSLGDTSQAVQGASAGFQFAGLGLAAINFVRIPLIYFFALIAKEKPPFTLSNNARWAYSAVVLGLVLTAILVPAIASPIGVVLASLSLLLSLVSIGNLIYKRYAIQKSLGKTNDDINAKEDFLKQIRQNAQTLQSELELLDKNDKNYKEKARKILMDIDELHAKYVETKNDLQGLYDKKLLDEQTLSRMGITKFLDRGVAAALASLAIIGLVLSIFFPPVGFGIVAASAGLGVLYLVGRVTVSLLAPLISSKIKEQGLSNTKTYENGESLDPSLDLDKSFELPNLSASLSIERNEGMVTDSTSKTMRGLFGPDAAKELRNLIHDAEEMNNLEAHVSNIVETKNHREALNFFRNLSVTAQAQECTHEDLRSLFEKVSNMDKVLPILENAINEVNSGVLVLSKEEKAELGASKPLMAILKQSAIDLSFLSSTQATTTSEEKPEVKPLMENH